MASKALSREVRDLVTTKTKAVRRRLSEATTMERLITGGTSPVGAAVAALADTHGVVVPLGRGQSIPISTVGTVIGIGTGLMLGRGALAAAAFGFGMGQLDAFVYQAVMGYLSPARAAAQHGEDEDDDE